MHKPITKSVNMTAAIRGDIICCDVSPDIGVATLYFWRHHRHVMQQTITDQSRPQMLIAFAPLPLETAKTIHKILVDYLIFANLRFYSIEKFNYI
jgi:hypothetical protein